MCAAMLYNCRSLWLFAGSFMKNPLDPNPTPGHEATSAIAILQKCSLWINPQKYTCEEFVTQMQQAFCEKVT